MDREIEELKRRVLLEPENTALKQRLENALERSVNPSIEAAQVQIKRKEEKKKRAEETQKKIRETAEERKFWRGSFKAWKKDEKRRKAKKRLPQDVKDQRDGTKWQYMTRNNSHFKDAYGPDYWEFYRR